MYMTFAFTISDFDAQCGCCSKSIDYRQCACKCHIMSIFTISTIPTTYLTLKNISTKVKCPTSRTPTKISSQTPLMRHF